MVGVTQMLGLRPKRRSTFDSFDVAENWPEACKLPSVHPGKIDQLVGVMGVLLGEIDGFPW